MTFVENLDTSAEASGKCQMDNGWDFIHAEGLDANGLPVAQS